MGDLTGAHVVAFCGDHEGEPGEVGDFCGGDDCDERGGERGGGDCGSLGGASSFGSAIGAFRSLGSNCDLGC